MPLDPNYKHPIPEEANSGECKFCHETIFWIKSKKGNWFPVNDDGSFHPSTCSERRDDER